MKRPTIGKALGVVVLGLAGLGLAGCGEEPQQGTQVQRKVDNHASGGAANAKFTADGWKAGDRASWEDQLRKRAHTQNEYIRFGN